MPFQNIDTQTIKKVCFCFLLILNVFCFLLYSGFTTPKQLLDLTDEKLINIGIDALGHRKKIIKAITNTRKQVQHKFSHES